MHMCHCAKSSKWHAIDIAQVDVVSNIPQDVFCDTISRTHLCRPTHCSIDVCKPSIFVCCNADSANVQPCWRWKHAIASIAHAHHKCWAQRQCTASIAGASSQPAAHCRSRRLAHHSAAVAVVHANWAWQAACCIASTQIHHRPLPKHFAHTPNIPRPRHGLCCKCARQRRH